MEGQVIQGITGGGADYCFECVGDVNVMNSAFESSHFVSRRLRLPLTVKPPSCKVCLVAGIASQHQVIRRSSLLLGASRYHLFLLFPGVRDYGDHRCGQGGQLSALVTPLHPAGPVAEVGAFWWVQRQEGTVRLGGTSERKQGERALTKFLFNAAALFLL